MKYLPLLGLLLLAACNKQQKNSQSSQIVNDTIPETRNQINSKAVATYAEKVKDPDGLNDWEFSVEAYETSATFQYLLKIQYMELRVTDTLSIPNFGIRPTVELRQGPNPLACVVGFLDKDTLFKEYKLVEIDHGQLKIRQLKSYRRGIYKKK